MRDWVVPILMIALMAGVLGSGGIAGTSVEITKIILSIVVILFLISVIIGIARGKRI